jgi:hypothetical protein
VWALRSLDLVTVLQSVFLKIDSIQKEFAQTLKSSAESKSSSTLQASKSSMKSMDSNSNNSINDNSNNNNNGNGNDDMVLRQVSITIIENDHH